MFTNDRPDKRQKATKVKCKRDESITKTINVCGICSSLDEAFEFCWISFADEHNTLPKLTRSNIKLIKCAFGTPWLPDLFCKHWFTSSVWNFSRQVADVPPCKTSPAASSEEQRLFSQAIPWSTSFNTHDLFPRSLVGRGTADLLRKSWVPISPKLEDFIYLCRELFLPLFVTKANCVVFHASRKRHSKNASSETSGGGPEEGELVPTKKKSRRTRESKEPKNENTEPREEGQRTPTPWACATLWFWWTDRSRARNYGAVVVSWDLVLSVFGLWALLLRCR